MVSTSSPFGQEIGTIEYKINAELFYKQDTEFFLPQILTFTSPDNGAACGLEGVDIDEKWIIGEPVELELHCTNCRLLSRCLPNHVT